MDATPAITPLVSLSADSGAESFLKNREQDAHQQLEAVFISMLIKELRTAGLEEGLFAGDASDTFGGMFDTFVGEELAKSGGIGLQRLFKDSVAPDVAQISEIRRQAQEAYGNAEAASIKPAGGS
ncbi:MAG: rod-binding protein [Planctomycetaceae bacterium]|jgi:Rod binding domain-containing protein